MGGGYILCGKAPAHLRLFMVAEGLLRLDLPFGFLKDTEAWRRARSAQQRACDLLIKTSITED